MGVGMLSEWSRKRADGQFPAECDVSQAPGGLEMSSQIPQTFYTAHP